VADPAPSTPKGGLEAPEVVRSELPPRLGGKPAAIAALAVIVVVIAGYVLLTADHFFEAVGLFEEPGKGLVVENVRVEWSTDGGTSILKVAGDIRNQVERQRPVPPIRIHLYNGRSELMERTIPAPVTTIDPWQKARFSADIEYPDRETNNVTVTFGPSRPKM
jgi:hypothetical protein